MEGPVLLAMGIDLSQDVTLFGEDMDGDITKIIEYDVDHPYALDPQYRVYHVCGQASAAGPNLRDLPVRGAYAEQLKASNANAGSDTDAPGNDTRPATPPMVTRHAGDFTKTMHGRTYEFLLYGVVPPVAPGTAWETTKQLIQFRKNAKSRYAISCDGHLTYNAGRRGRKDPVRNIRLKLAPILIIPFEDEIGQVRHARVYTPHARTDTHLLVCRSSLTIMQ
jgi:hypothetical protein